MSSSCRLRRSLVVFHTANIRTQSTGTNGVPAYLGELRETEIIDERSVCVPWSRHCNTSLRYSRTTWGHEDSWETTFSPLFEKRFLSCSPCVHNIDHSENTCSIVRAER